MRSCFLLLLLLLSAKMPSYASEEEHLHFVFVVPSYNNEQFVEKNLSSILMQVIPPNTDVDLYYGNDASTDKTKENVEAFVAAHGLQDKWHIINNTIRKKSLANFYEIIHTLNPKDIVIFIDGDDWLANKYVLVTIAKAYRTPINGKKIWMTYGNSYRSIPDGMHSVCREIPPDVVVNNRFRSFAFVASHLRTFYAGLFQKIQKKDLLWNGKFFPLNTDMATMIPMLEMSSKGHFLFIQKILYIYNNNNPINCGNVNNPMRLLYPETEAYIRSQAPYTPLDTLFE